MDDFTIFTESNEDMGLLYNSYKEIGKYVDGFLKVIEEKISQLLRDPDHTSADLREEINKFKSAVDKKPTPSAINMDKVGSIKASVKNYRSEMEKLLDRYAKARNKMSFGGNLMRSIIMKPKVYSKNIDPESYDRNNKNIRNIDRALDWIEKVLIDLFNLIDQDLNILTIVGKVYGKKKIYEQTEIFQSGDFNKYKVGDDDLLAATIGDFDEATIGAYKNGVIEIPVSNTKYKARVEQLIRRYQAPIDSGDIILVIQGREDFINNMMKDCGCTRKQAEYDFDNDKIHGYIMSNVPLRVNITERKYAVGGFNKTYEMLVLHECTHSIVNSIPQAHVLTSNFQEGIAIYESGMLKHMLEQFRKRPTIGGRKYYPPLLRSTLQVRNIIEEKGYNYLIKIIKGSIREPHYDEFIHESGFKYNGSTIARLDLFTEDRYFKVLKSDLDNDYKPKGHRSLYDFNKIHITKELTKKFRDQGKLIKWMRDQDPKYGDDCFLWVDDNGDYVGAVTYDQEYDKDHHKWISGIDIAYKYAGYGIGKQILEEAIFAGANALDVQKDNMVALKMYERRGFRISEESKKKVDANESVTYQMFLDDNLRYVNNDPPAGRASMKVCYIDPHTNTAHMYPAGYDRPLPYDLLPDHLKNDDIHVWRARTGIELIHKEPSMDELNRIWKNWKLMSDQMKRISDEKSMSVFGKTNKDHFNTISDSENDSFTEASVNDPPPNMPAEGDENNGERKEQSEGDREIPQTSDVPVEGAEVHDREQETESKEPKEEVKEESMPKKTDKVESSKNGVRRKKLYVAFIEWAKEYNSKNTFGSIFDKDIFHNVYPFVPDEMRYFYRLANPILCVLSGDLTFFQVSELKKLNAENKEIDKLLIFAATPNDLRVFNREDKRVYVATESNGKIELEESVGDTFDLYIQKMINKGDILNGSTDLESE